MMPAPPKLEIQAMRGVGIGRLSEKCRVWLPCATKSCISRRAPSSTPT